jgi:hypothetical protein
MSSRRVSEVRRSRATFTEKHVTSGAVGSLGLIPGIAFGIVNPHQRSDHVASVALDAQIETNRRICDEAEAVVRADGEATKALADVNAVRTELRAVDATRVRYRPGGGPWMGLVLLAAGAVCFGAEVTLTRETVCFLLSIPKHSPAGLALAIAPATALLVLGVIFERGLERPWRAWRTENRPRWLDRIIGLSMVGVLVAVALGSIAMVALLAQVREQAATYMHVAKDMPFGLQVPVVDRTLVLRNVVALSLFVAVAGALLLAIGAADINDAVRRAACSLRVWALKARLRRFERRAIDCQTEAKVRVDKLRYLENGKPLADEQVRHRANIQVGQAITLSATQMPSNRKPLTFREHVDRMKQDIMARLDDGDAAHVWTNTAGGAIDGSPAKLNGAARRGDLHQ